MGSVLGDMQAAQTHRFPCSIAAEGNAKNVSHVHHRSLPLHSLTSKCDFPAGTVETFEDLDAHGDSSHPGALLEQHVPDVVLSDVTSSDSNESLDIREAQPQTDDQRNFVLGDTSSSVGAANHGTDCKPCAWFWKSAGCSNGRECLHCHACPQGELKARRKIKKQIT